MDTIPEALTVEGGQRWIVQERVGWSVWTINFYDELKGQLIKFWWQRKHNNNIEVSIRMGKLQKAYHNMQNNEKRAKFNKNHYI
jgi:hypothetical protein